MNAEALIESEEGRRRIGYYDTRGVPTNGIGHTGKDVRVGVEVSDAQVDTWFAEDYATALRGVTAVLDWFPRLDPVRQAYIISMAFQMGASGLLTFHRFLGAVRDERWAAAAGEMLASDWAKQTPARARRAARAIETGEWQVTA